MKSTEHVAQSVSISKMGIFATLRGRLRVPGIGAPKGDHGGDALSRLILSILATTFGVLVFTAVPAMAAAPEAPETLAAGPVAVSSATLNGVLNSGALLEPPQSGTYEFLYKQSATECAGGTTAPDPAGVVLGLGAEPESQPLTGLLPGTVYTYCLLARNAALETTVGPAVTFTTHGPGITEEQVTHVEATTATLQANIDPNESETTYHFEYDTTPYTSGAAHGASVPVPNASIGSGTSPVPVSVRLKGLQPGSTYYYRVVAVSAPLGAPETFDGPGKALTTNALPSSAPESCPNAQARSEQPYGQTLPDCRAYELVSPINKDDNSVLFPDSRASESGEALTYLSPGSFAEPKSGLIASRYIARREQDGWASQNISPRYTALETAIVPPFTELLFSPDLSRGLLESEYTPLNDGEPAGFINLYVADTSDGAYQLATTVHSPGLLPYTGNGHAPQLDSAGVSTDLSHVVFQEKGDFTEGAPETRRQHVYEWANGDRAQVDVPPVGGKLEAEDVVGAPGLEGYYRYGDEWHAVSADGSRVYFTGGEGSGEAIHENEGQLYVRENPMSPVEGCAAPGDACTVEVSASRRNTLDPNDHTLTAVGGQKKLRPARYWDASADGSRVFFTSRAELTNDANTGAADSTENLYEYNLEDGVLTDLTPENAEGGGVLGVVTASEDGSYVYFVAEGVLSAEANGEHESAEPDKPNLYLYHAGKLSFIARLAPATIGGNQMDTAEEGGDARDWNGTQLEASETPTKNSGPGQHSARVSADGALAFESELSLTGYDNQQAKSGECEGFYGGVYETGRCREVYLYDAATGRLRCASCNPSGTRPVGPAELGGQEQEGSSGAGASPSPFYLPRNLSEDGERLFFQSQDALVPQDSNGLVDVYEWESRGVGACTSTAASYSSISEGCVYAISDVAGSYESHFMDASANGDDVFIVTKDQLVPEADGDSRVNAYDVRIGGGFPVSVAPPACTNADSCKPPVSPQPGVFGTPASATFSGPGNPVPPPPSPPPAVVKPAKKTVKCPKGRTRNEHGKCVRRKSKRRKAKKFAHTNRRASS